MSDKEKENIESEAVVEEVLSTETSEDPVEASSSTSDELASGPVESEPVLDEASVEVLEEPKADTNQADLEEDASKSLSAAKLSEDTPANIIKSIENAQLKQDIPPFRPGDTVVVNVKVQEGNRSRLQAYEGVVMNIKNAGLNSSFIVRKISSGIGVERTFQIHSPLIDSITVKRKGDVRKAKLYFLRERSGRSARIKERLD